MKIVVAQYWTSNLSYGKYTKAINERYCNNKNYIYHAETDNEKITKGKEDRTYTWYKPKFLLEILELYNPDYILFLDADAVVSDESYSIEEFIKDNYEIIATEDHGPSTINAGVIIFKNSSWVKNFLNSWWGYGEKYSEYKNALWWDQTCFGLLYSDLPDKDKILIISNRILNWREYDENNFIFHAFAYGSLPDRRIDEVYNTKFSIIKRKIGDDVPVYVVYHCFLINDWYTLINSQLFILKASGLLDKAKQVYCMVCDPLNQRSNFDFKDRYGDKLVIEYIDNNNYEFPALKKVYDLANKEVSNILYFHTKGISNNYTVFGSDAKNDLKIKSINDWKDYLTYFCIEKWQENIVRLDYHDMVGATCNGNWWWGNFWWATSDYIKTHNPPPEHGPRWDAEAWVNKDGKAKIFEHWHIDFTFYLTDYPSKFYINYDKYKTSNINIVSAYYGYDGVQIDEGWRIIESPALQDVTDIVKVHTKNNKIKIRVDNDVMKCDPCYGYRKGLYIKYTFDIEPETVYNLFSMEGHVLQYPYFK